VRRKAWGIVKNTLKQMINLTRKTDGKLECLLCPHYCKLAPGRTGICGVRKNTGEKIELITYGVLSGYSLDPVEKKPLYHFFPGHNILSLGSFGCNMRCDFCQNFHISQKIPVSLVPEISTDNLISEALSARKNIGIAFTYNEPIIWFEYMKEVAEKAKERGLYTVMVSNGYVNSEPLREIIHFIDAFNIDLKAFNKNFYRKLTGAKLEPVQNSLKQISRAGKHLEITTLVIPGENDDEKEMANQAKWIAKELGRNIPLHLSKYFPNYKRVNPQTSETSLKTLFNIASGYLDYVYMGNSHTDIGQNTKCPNCGTEVTMRSGYNTMLFNLDNEGKCSGCGNLIYSNFTIS
jgi:pyruvate formate lyase activating enzyme